MKITLEISETQANTAKNGIAAWSSDSMITVSVDGDTSTLTNSGGNTITVSNNTLTYEGRRHAILSNNSITDIFESAGLVARLSEEDFYTFEVTKTGQQARVISYTSYRTDRPWYEYGLTQHLTGQALKRAQCNGAA